VPAHCGWRLTNGPLHSGVEVVRAEKAGIQLKEITYETLFPSNRRRVGCRCRGINIGVCVSVPGPRFKRRIDLGRRAHLRKSPAFCATPLSCRRRDRLPYRPLSMKPIVDFGGQPMVAAVFDELGSSWLRLAGRSMHGAALDRATGSTFAPCLLKVSLFPSFGW